MPLDKSGSKESVGKNIKTEEAAGKDPKQAEAIALHTRDEVKHPHYDKIYRGHEKKETVTSDRNEKLSIKGVAPEHITLAIQRLSAPKRSGGFVPRVHLSRKA